MQNITTRLALIYRQSLYGGLGALIGSAIHQHFLVGAETHHFAAVPGVVINAAMGFIFGMCIAATPAIVEGLRHYSLFQMSQRTLVAGLCGGVGAMIAAPLAEWIHWFLGGGVLGRVIAWSMFGASIGLAEAVNGGGSWWRGVLGGLIGGAFGGLLLELFISPSQFESNWGILAIFVVGFSIMATLTIFVHLLSNACLEGLEGSKVAGQVYQLGKYRSPARAIIGSARKSGVLVWIPGADDQHASLTLTPTGTILRHVGSHGRTLVSGSPVSETTLREGDVIEICGCRLRYRQSMVTRFLPFLSGRDLKLAG